MSPTHTSSPARPVRIAGIALAAALFGAGVSGVVATLSATAPASAPAPAATAPVSPTAALPAVTSYSPVVDKVAPAVVTIRIERRAEATQTDVPAPFREFFG